MSVIDAAHKSIWVSRAFFPYTFIEQHKRTAATHAHFFPRHPLLRRSMILYVFLWLQLLVVAPFSFAQDPNKPKCTDSDFNWVSARVLYPC
jgi:hypothetical protein